MRRILARMLREDKIRIEHLVPYDQAGKIQQIRKYGELLTEEIPGGRIWVEAYVPAGMEQVACERVRQCSRS